MPTHHGVGDVVQATVERVVVFGVYLRSGDATILVLAVETADTPTQCREKMASLAVGQVETVTIQRFVEDDGVFVGSMKTFGIA